MKPESQKQSQIIFHNIMKKPKHYTALNLRIPKAKETIESKFQQTFSVNGQIVNILHFAGTYISVPSSLLPPPPPYAPFSTFKYEKTILSSRAFKNSPWKRSIVLEKIQNSIVLEKIISVSINNKGLVIKI